MCSTDPYAVPILLTIVTIGVGIGGALVGSGLEKNCNLLINSWKFLKIRRNEIWIFVVESGEQRNYTIFSCISMALGKKIKKSNRLKKSWKIVKTKFEISLLDPVNSLA